MIPLQITPPIIHFTRSFFAWLTNKPTYSLVTALFQMSSIGSKFVGLLSREICLLEPVYDFSGSHIRHHGISTNIVKKNPGKKSPGPVVLKNLECC